MKPLRFPEPYELWFYANPYGDGTSAHMDHMGRGASHVCFLDNPARIIGAEVDLDESMKQARGGWTRLEDGSIKVDRMWDQDRRSPPVLRFHREKVRVVVTDINQLHYYQRQAQEHVLVPADENTAQALGLMGRDKLGAMRFDDPIAKLDAMKAKAHAHWEKHHGYEPQGALGPKPAPAASEEH